jgi:hypothetical protein
VSLFGQAEAGSDHRISRSFFNAAKTRNAGIAFHPPIRHDPIAIKLHDQTPGALAKSPDSGCTTTRREQ